MGLDQFVLLLHLLGAGVLIGVAVFSVVLSISKPVDQSRLQSIALIRRFGTYSVGLLIITGVYLAWQHYGGWPTIPRFWIKMGLIVLDGILAQVIIKQKINRAMNGDTASANGLPLWTSISALVILLIVTLGFLTTSGN
ncbi:MAG: hypothetical protein Q8Q05_02250 [bacterium]|nr:hypothetical protein [bacterium]